MSPGTSKASLSGSIIGNILLALGLSIVAGGIGREKQTFSRAAAGTNTTMLFVAVTALVMPAVYEVSVLGGLHHLAISVEPERWTHLKAKIDSAGIATQHIDGSSLSFTGPDGERLELISDPLEEMYGRTIG